MIVVDAGQQAFPLIGKLWWLFRVFGDTRESLEEAERRLFYVAVTRAVDTLILVTDNSVQYGGLTSLVDDAAVDMVTLDWDSYSPPGASGRLVCSIAVTNLTGSWQEEGGTVAIKHLLKENGYVYAREPSPRWLRASLVPEHGGIGVLWPSVMREAWVEEADRVLVSFSVGGKDQVLLAVNRGIWTLLRDDSLRDPDAGREAK